MKKRYLIAGALIAVGVIAVITESPEDKAARQLAHQQSRERIAKAEAEHEKQFVISPAERTQCRLAIQQAMHDPRSFRWEGSMSDMRRTGVLRFSGTNGFGGRVQQTYRCGS